MSYTSRETSKKLYEETQLGADSAGLDWYVQDKTLPSGTVITERDCPMYELGWLIRWLPDFWPGLANVRLAINKTSAGYWDLDKQAWHRDICIIGNDPEDVLAELIRLVRPLGVKE